MGSVLVDWSLIPNKSFLRATHIYVRHLLAEL